MKTISINGYILECSLLLDDPDAKMTLPDHTGQLRHVRSFSQPGHLKRYLRKHPEGIILAGTGTIFFLEPIPVSSVMVRFDDSGNADIRIREDTEVIEKQLVAMDTIRATAQDQFCK